MSSEHKFSFAGDDFDSEEDDDVTIENDPTSPQANNLLPSFSSDSYEKPLPHFNRLHVAETGSLRRQSNSVSSSAFPVDGKPLLPATYHSLDELISTLPDRITYHTLTVELDDGTSMKIPRRDLHDAKMQAMAEDEMIGENSGDGAMVGLGAVDVKTGIYEGGFKSWESSIDLVKELAAEDDALWDENVVEVSHVFMYLPSFMYREWYANFNSLVAGPLYHPLHSSSGIYNAAIKIITKLSN